MPKANGQENKSKLFLKRKQYKKVEQEEKTMRKERPHGRSAGKIRSKKNGQEVKKV